MSSLSFSSFHMEPGMVLAIALYIAVMLGIGFFSARVSQRAGANGAGGFMQEYFLAGRGMGGVALAMSVVTTYTSASSFIGGPGVAYTLGLGWVLLAMIQVPTTFLTLGIMGRRLAAYSRRTGAVTISDFLRARYGSKTLVMATSLFMLLFFMAVMLSQFIGGARIFEAATGVPYSVGLMLFGLTVIAYTTIGGFRAVVITDVVQGFVMLFAAVALLVGIVDAGGGLAACMEKLARIDPGLIAPTGAQGKIPVPFLLSFWVLVGLGVLGLPQTAQKCMAFKDDRALCRGMLVGTVVIGFLLFCTHMSGALGRAVLPDLPAGDLIMPSLTVRLLPPFVAGIFLAGVLAAIMSTVSSMLIMASATLIRDIYVYGSLRGEEDSANPAFVRRASLCITAVLGLAVFALALRPPDLLVWINLFAFGGLEAVFLWPVVLGLFWKKANARGALFSVFAGVFFFMGFTPVPDNLLALLPQVLADWVRAVDNPLRLVPLHGVHPIVPSLVVSGLAFVLGNACGKSPGEKRSSANC
ncbi:sodium/pantothenate symporter [Desulfovibrio sp. OttesenSCG-928-G15]|nr:sodium/pantothenate symporter [Desulfovibrio sp. OttesenSCG-928-G15]